MRIPIGSISTKSPSCTKSLSKWNHTVTIAISNYPAIPLCFLWIVSGCKRHCDKIEGVVLTGVMCSGDKAILVQVKNSNIGTSYQYSADAPLDNVILIQTDGIHPADSSYLIGGASCKFRETIFFEFKEEPIETPYCPALFTLPSVTGKVYNVSKNPCPH